MAEANALVEAVERRGAHFNMGTNRRWHPGFHRMRAWLDREELGPLRTLVIYGAGTLFNTASHNFDLLFYLNRDTPVRWARGYLPRGPELLQGDRLVDDPVGEGFFEFANGVRAYAMHTRRGTEFEAICEQGTITSRNNGMEWEVRRSAPLGRRTELKLEPFPTFVPASTTLNLIEDLVQALDTGEPTRGGIRVAHANTELIFAFAESHRRDRTVELPLTECTLRLTREYAPRQPRVAP
ncbi:MAG: Gfo/Idh/MocA family oxidoreductase [Armatimonadetes bacterium]|nr:Gfo/Idh/MocA family oxidoreductase [Armatimonadota bacterium]